MAAIVAYRNDKQPFAELVLDSGAHVTITLDTAGAVIRQISGAAEAGEILFQGSPEVVARICTGLTDGKGSDPLKVLVNAVQGLGSPAKIRDAFHQIASIVTE